MIRWLRKKFPCLFPTKKNWPTWAERERPKRKSEDDMCSYCFLDAQMGKPRKEFCAFCDIRRG